MIVSVCSDFWPLHLNTQQHSNLKPSSAPKHSNNARRRRHCMHGKQHSATDLAVSFRQMSANRDAQLSVMDGRSPAVYLSSTPFALSTRLGADCLTTGARSTGVRTIHIGSLSRSASPTAHAPSDVPPVQLNIPRDLFTAADTPLRRSPAAQPHVVRGDTGEFAVPLRTTPPGVGVRHLSEPKALPSALPTRAAFGSVDSVLRHVPSGAAVPAATDDDCFDRSLADLSSAVRGASPREYAPEYEGLLPLPDTPPTSGSNEKATPLDIFQRGGAKLSSYDVALGALSPPPKMPAELDQLTRSSASARSLLDMNPAGRKERQEASRSGSHDHRLVSSSGGTSPFMDFNGIAVPLPPALALGQSEVVPAARSPSLQLPYRQHRPSKFLAAIVEAVALRKGATVVDAIPPNVVEAFDSVVRDGAYFIKYSTTGAPHERFFQIRFVDVAGKLPEPCLSWSVHRNSWAAKGVINLASLKQVVAGAGTAAFRKSLIDERRIHGPMIGGPQRAILPVSFAFSIQFIGGTDATEDSLSLLSLNADVFDAWLLFLTFLTRIGARDDANP